MQCGNWSVDVYSHNLMVLHAMALNGFVHSLGFRTCLLAVHSLTVTPSAEIVQQQHILAKNTFGGKYSSAVYAIHCTKTGLHALVM